MIIKKTTIIRENNRDIDIYYARMQSNNLNNGAGIYIWNIQWLYYYMNKTYTIHINMR